MSTLDHQQPQTCQVPAPPSRSSSLNLRQQVRLKGWLHTVRKKTARLSTRITASLGLISLTKDEEFDHYHESFKHIEKTIRLFSKNLSTFVEHFENFLLSLQNTSENLSEFYRGKSHQREQEELRRKNKALACEHFHAFRRTVDRQVLAVTGQLMQKFAGPHQLINKRFAKLLDYDTRMKEMESCRDSQKKDALRDQYVIAKELYDRLNEQLKRELPVFNQFALDIFKQCIMVLLESRRNLILSYTKQTESLLETPLMMTYTASNITSRILMSCETKFPDGQGLASGDSGGWSSPISEKSTDRIVNDILDQDRKVKSRQSSSQGTRPSDDYNLSRPHSALSQLSSEFDQMALGAREISSTPLSHISRSKDEAHDEPDGRVDTPMGTSGSSTKEKRDPDISVESNHLEEEDNGSKAPRLPDPPASRSPQCISEQHEISMNDSRDERRRKMRSQIYIADWPFVAIGPNQLTIAYNQPVKLIKPCDECGNRDWSLVRDRKGQMGYVPTSYIRKKE